MKKLHEKRSDRRDNETPLKAVKGTAERRKTVAFLAWLLRKPAHHATDCKPDCFAGTNVGSKQGVTHRRDGGPNNRETMENLWH